MQKMQNKEDSNPNSNRFDDATMMAARGWIATHYPEHHRWHHSYYTIFLEKIAQSILEGENSTINRHACPCCGMDKFHKMSCYHPMKLK
jgi:hypothetical protein